MLSQIELENRVAELHAALEISHDAWHALRKIGGKVTEAVENAIDEEERWQIEEALGWHDSKAAAVCCVDCRKVIEGKPFFYTSRQPMCHDCWKTNQEVDADCS